MMSYPDDIKKKFMLPLMTELQDHKEKVFHNDPVSPTFALVLVVDGSFVIKVIHFSTLRSSFSSF